MNVLTGPLQSPMLVLGLVRNSRRNMSQKPPNQQCCQLVNAAAKFDDLGVKARGVWVRQKSGTIRHKSIQAVNKLHIEEV